MQMVDVRPSARPIQSCIQCRRRKIKCSRSYPCAPCLLRGEGQTCKEVDRNAVEASKKPSDQVDIVQRVQALEATVTKLSRLLAREFRGETADAGVETFLGPVSASVTTPTTNSALTSDADTRLGPSIRASFGSGSSEEDMAMMLEDFAMGHKVNRTRATQDAEGDSVCRRDDHANPSLPLPISHPLALLVDSSIDVVARLVRTLPGEWQSQCLIQFYFDRLDWYSKVLHRPTFLSESETLQQQITRGNLSLVRISFLGVYCMVLCLAVHLIEPHVAERLHLDLLTTSGLSQRLYSAAQACLQYDDFLGSHSLEHLQCIILMSVYQQNLDEADSHWALLGTAIKIAQNLGLSRLGSESDGHCYPAGWRSAVKREIARRVWWSLIFDDWSHAAAHNGTYSIHPSQNHTGYPANVDDIDLVEGHPVKSRPPAEYTEMTSLICRLRFVEMYRQVVDYMQAPTGYTFITDMDLKISQFISELPSYFRSSDREDRITPGSIKGLEMTLCLIMGETRRLRLHRPFLFRGYKERKYVKSREQCVHSAKAILGHLKNNHAQSAILLKWWIVLFYGFAAAVVLFIDLCHHKADEGPELEERRSALRDALELFKAAEHISTVSRNAIALLEGLLGILNYVYPEEVLI
ncbi:fungal-specific transcription factor domain-containing protein [Collybia nuda]|uniref:Fungal-specific transcription factor domain-containing protein n=1 Tax=Collybia nuda TaxID=64659 RepID=A0A9P5XUG8_9AGAR|nr:fungal-specific transcription factor domain-containing protein [Collybia nuda]